MDKKFLAFCIMFFCLGMAVGMLIVLNSDFQYKDASIMTCEYANKLTVMINLQSETLKLYTDTDYDVLDKLDCGRLK